MIIRTALILFAFFILADAASAQRECYQPYLSLAEKLIKEKNYPSAKQKLADMEKSCELDAAANSKVNELRNKIPVATTTTNKSTALPHFVKKGEQYILVNSAGVQQGRLLFDYHADFRDGLCEVRVNKKYGFINTLGEPVIPIIYESSQSYFYDGLAQVVLNNKTGYVNRSGNVVIPFIYDPGQTLSSFSQGLVKIKKDGKTGYIDTKGTTIIPFIYDDGSSFIHGSAILIQWGKYGLVDRSGKIILPISYNYIHHMVYEGKMTFSCRTEQGTKKGWVDSAGKIVIPCIYDDVTFFSDGLACVMIKDKLGFADNTGKLVIPMMYDTTKYIICNFSEGLAPVFKNGKAGYIDKKNNLVIPYQFSYAERFYRGTAGAIKDGKSVIINRQGKVVRTLR